jgi:hypothetical protein
MAIAHSGDRDEASSKPNSVSFEGAANYFRIRLAARSFKRFE